MKRALCGREMEERDDASCGQASGQVWCEGETEAPDAHAMMKCESNLITETCEMISLPV